MPIHALYVWRQKPQIIASNPGVERCGYFIMAMDKENYLNIYWCCFLQVREEQFIDKSWPFRQMWSTLFS